MHTSGMVNGMTDEEKIEEGKLSASEPNVEAGYTSLPPHGPTLWNEVSVKAADYAGYDVYGLIRLHGRRLELDQLTVVRRTDGEQITGYNLRSISPQTLFQLALEASWFKPPETGGEILNLFDGRWEGPNAGAGMFTRTEVDDAKAAGPVDDTLRMVGKLYTLAYALNDAPAKAVAQTFKVSARTAGNWISKAKQAGYIAADEATEGASDA